MARKASRSVGMSGAASEPRSHRDGADSVRRTSRSASSAAGGSRVVLEQAGVELAVLTEG